MLRIRYSEEASNYFFDNGELVFSLRYAVESLVFSDGKAQDGSFSELPGSMFVWEILDHTVIYSIEGEWLIVRIVIPD